MVDPFLTLSRGDKVSPALLPGNEGRPHSERKHSKFSASGAERWFNCPGSVALSEGIPDRSSPWAEEGTRAHEVLEKVMREALSGKALPTAYLDDMLRHGVNAAKFILNLAAKTPYSEVIVEDRVYLDFIHPEMFGTFDGAIIDYFGILHVFDYKYGAGVPVSPVRNLQMIFYGIGLAHAHQWNFKGVRLWIIQPRVKGFDGPVFWDVPILELKSWVKAFERGVEEVLRFPEKYVEGSYCHWCRAKPVCPLKREVKLEAAKNVFSLAPIEG